MKNTLSRLQPACRQAWDFFSSNFTAVVLLVLLAGISILGTVIPQKQPPEVYAKLFGEVFSGLFYFLGLTNLYASPVFIFISILLGISLLVCSSNRLLSAVQGKLDLYLWGSFLAHISVLIIYLGVIYGSQAGFSTDANILKGEAYFEPHEKFSVRLNDFNARFDAEGRPLNFTSDLSVIEDGKEILRKTIFVNKPLAYKGVKFYQSNYGLQGEFEISGPGGKKERVSVGKGGCITYSLTGQMFHVAELFPNLEVLHGRPMEVYEPTNPIALIQDVDWIIKGKAVRVGDYNLKLIKAKEYTGLQVKKDPGVPIVYLGFLFLSFGAGVMLYAKH